MVKLKTRPTTMVVMVIAETVCKVWQVCRCKFRNKNDFNYFVTDLRSQYPNELVYKSAVGNLPYYSKTLEVDDEYERSSSIKLGDCCITYTFDKFVRNGIIPNDDVVPLHEQFDPYLNMVENVITQTKISHNAPDKLKVIKLTRKERDVVKLHSK